MFVIDVIPLIKTIGIDNLSYFTSKEVILGDMVIVPLRSKKVRAIVTKIRNVEDLKGEIKNASFALKKLDRVKSTNFLGKEFMEMAETISNYYTASIGSVLFTLVPEYILGSAGKLKIEKKGQSKKINSKEKYVVQGDDEERYGSWKTLIRQEFAKKKSLFFLFPTIEEAEYAFTLLEKGIEGYAFLLHGSFTKKEILEKWNKMTKEEHPIVIVATGGFLSFPRNDIETIIVERESSKSYKTIQKPYLDMRMVAETLAEKKGVKIFLADNFLRVETLAKTETGEPGEFKEASPFKWRSLSTAKDFLIDMRIYKDQNRTSFRILSAEMENLIKRSKDESEHMIILATRRGLSPSTVCGDCQNIVTCNNCSAPVILHKTQNKEDNEGKTFFMCHRCGERRSTEEYCKICGSWKLGVVGIGIDLVEEKIKDRFPDINIFRIDSDTTPRDKMAKSVIQKFLVKPGSLLIGTEMMLQYLHEKVENSAIISLDSLFSLPDFRIQEKILHMLIRMRTLSTRNFIVQTRKADSKVFEYGLKGNMSDFYKNTLEERKQFNYPPFSVLIKIILEGKKEEIVKEMEKTQTALEPYEIEVFPAFTHTVKGNYVLHGLIRLKKDKWPDMFLVEKIRSLSPAIKVKVDPETLL